MKVRWGRRLLGILPLPLLFSLAAIFEASPVVQPVLQPLRDSVMNWRFLYRGEVAVPDVKIVYANLDSEGLNAFGERPWPRHKFAQLNRILYDVGKAKTVGFDFIFSPQAASELVDIEKKRASDNEFSLNLAQYPKTVLAAHFSQIDLPLTPNEIEAVKRGEFVQTKHSEVPYVEDHPSLRNAPPAPDETFPELPTYPIFRPGRENVGLITLAEHKNTSSVPRWAVMFAEVSGPYYALNYVEGFRHYHENDQLEVEFVPPENPSEVYLSGTAKQTMLTLPKLERMPLEAALAELEAQGVVVFDPENVLVDEHFVQLSNQQGHVVARVPRSVDGRYQPVSFTRDTFRRAYPEPVEFIEVGGKWAVVATQPLPPQILPLDLDMTFYSFSLKLALEYLDLTVYHVEHREDELIVRDDDEQVRLRIPLTDGQLVETNYFSRFHNLELNPQTSVAHTFQQYVNLRDGDEALQAEAREYFEMFNDAIVLVGPVDQTLQDLAPTPFSSLPVPKVGMHGNLLKTFFTGDYIKRLGLGWEIAFIFLLTYVVAILGTQTGQYSGWYNLGAFVILAAYLFAAFQAFASFTLVVPVLLPVLSAFLSTTGGVVYHLLNERQQRTRIKGLFGNYVSPELVDQMVELGEEPTLGGEDVEISAFFTDIQSFTTFSEVLSPPQLVELMNEYLSEMTDVLHHEGGTLDKYIGDAMVGIFNAPVRLPDHAWHACRAAVQMQQRQAYLREKWARDNRWPKEVTEMRTRIGINTGRAVVGNMGSYRRFNYTMMGDTVNLAARGESGSKQVGVYTLVTEDTVEQVQRKTDHGLVFRFLDRWRVKGRLQPVDIYELVGFKSEVSDEEWECLETYGKGLDAYFDGNWAVARRWFEASLRRERLQPGRDPGVPTNPSAVMLARLQALEEVAADSEWDGVYELENK